VGNNQEANRNIRVDIAKAMICIKYMSDKYGGEIYGKLYMWMDKSYIKNCNSGVIARDDDMMVVLSSCHGSISVSVAVLKKLKL
jgi:hypothetical protein